MTCVNYQSMALRGTTKVGRINCDPDGYYTLLAGGFDAYNSAGAFYDWLTAKAHFDLSSHFQRRVKNGALFGEDGHPTMLPGMTKEQWITRILTVDSDRKSHHIKEVSIDESLFKNEDGVNIKSVWIRVKPMGVRAQVLADSLENENVNTAFSIRCLTRDTVNPFTRVLVKQMLEVVTFDHVDEPGIKTATKYNNPSLECLDVGDSLFTDKHLRSAIDYARNTYNGFESADIAERIEGILEKTSGGILVPKSGIIGSAARPRSTSWR